MPLKRSRDSLARPLIPACPRPRVAPPYGVSPRWRVLAEDSNEDKNREGAEGREDECRPGRDADRERSEIDVRADPDRPQERDDTVIDRRGPRHVRHVQDSNQRRLLRLFSIEPPRPNLQSACERRLRPVSTSCKVCCGNVENCISANCALFVFRTSCGRTWPLLDSRLRRARSASRSKPELKAVGGSRRSAEPVDESEIDSANETATLGWPFRFTWPRADPRRLRRRGLHAPFSRRVLCRRAAFIRR